MTWDTVWDVVGSVCLVIGTLFTLAAAIGVVRFSDLLLRLHATAKPQAVGLAFMLLGFAAIVREPGVAWTCVLVVLFQMITAPISAHLAARSGYRTGQVHRAQLVTDEYWRDLRRAYRDRQRTEARRGKADRGDRPS